jgi:hypothetical protein
MRGHGMKHLRKRSVLTVGGIALGFMVVGCAATQTITVKSEPLGARVIVNDVQMGTTPTEVELSKKDAGVILRIEKDGYGRMRIPLERHFDSWGAPKTLGIPSTRECLSLSGWACSRTGH